MLKGAPLPLSDFDTQPFWDGCREGKFLLPRCRGCGEFRWPPGPMCPQCQSIESEWVSAQGSGRVYSWVVAHHPPNSTMSESVPYPVGLIELVEGIRVVGNIGGCEPEEIEAGLPVEIFFEEIGDGVRLPNFRRRR